MSEIFQFFSATRILSHSPIVYNFTASFDKLTCAVYVDIGKGQDKFGQFFWSKKDLHYLDGRLNVFKKDDNKEFRPD